MSPVRVFSPAFPATRHFGVDPARPERAFEFVEGWGMAVGAHARLWRPRSLDELARTFALARERGTTLALRGGGNSYGDASVSSRGDVLDLTRMNRFLDWNPESGVAVLEPGVTIEQLWKRILPDGWWPRVVSGTMFPTVAGAAAMNIHGKNNFAVGTLGDAIREFDLWTPRGEHLTCNRTQNPELFHAAIGGFGMLGVFTRLVLETKRVHSGNLRVRAVSTASLAEMIEFFLAHQASSDYLVGWVDCFKGGRALGRGLVHQAHYLHAGEDPDPRASLRVEHQELPTTVLGLLPKSEVWRGLRLFNHDWGMRLVNAAKFLSGELESQREPFLQSHAGFAFLLDYVPNWKWAYGRRPLERGLIQYQTFVPKEHALAVHSEMLVRSQRAGLVPYLGVYKRHRPDPFLLTHAVDGFSFALDFKVEPATREKLWRLCHELSELVIEAGGRFYFAKDALIRPADARRAWPSQALEAFFAHKRQHDPESLLQTDLSRRVFPVL